MSGLDEEIPEHLRAETIDMSSFARDDQLKHGRKLAFEYAVLKQQIEDAEANIERWKIRKTELERRELPEYFDGVLKTDLMGLPEAGVDVQIVPFYHANIKSEWPEDQRNRAFDYLVEIEYEDVISVNLVVKFEREEYAEAKELEALIRQSKFGNSHTPKLEMGVPWNTLTKIVRERTESGQATDLEVLGATVGRTAKIKKRRK